jgi:hypothetical protein
LSGKAAHLLDITDDRARTGGDAFVHGIESAEVSDAFCYALEKRADGRVGAVRLERMEKVGK